MALGPLAGPLSLPLPPLLLQTRARAALRDGLVSIIKSVKATQRQLATLPAMVRAPPLSSPPIVKLYAPPAIET